MEVDCEAGRTIITTRHYRTKSGDCISHPQGARPRVRERNTHAKVHY